MSETSIKITQMRSGNADNILLHGLLTLGNGSLGQ